MTKKAVCWMVFVGVDGSHCDHAIGGIHYRLKDAMDALESFPVTWGTKYRTVQRLEFSPPYAPADSVRVVYMTRYKQNESAEWIEQ